MRLAMAGLVVSLLIAVSVQAQSPDPLGEQFQVNTYTTGSQWSPTVSANAVGRLVVAWSSTVQGEPPTPTSLPYGDPAHCQLEAVHSLPACARIHD